MTAGSAYIKYLILNNGQNFIKINIGLEIILFLEIIYLGSLYTS